eukprot:3527493-Lingulodinium_polyedra.AAC.1
MCGVPAKQTPGPGAGGGPLGGDNTVDALIELLALGLRSTASVRDVGAAAHDVALRDQTGAPAALGPANTY